MARHGDNRGRQCLPYIDPTPSVDTYIRKATLMTRTTAAVLAAATAGILNLATTLHAAPAEQPA